MYVFAYLEDKIFNNLSGQLSEFSKIIQIMQPKFQNIGLKTQMEVASACKFLYVDFISSVFKFHFNDRFSNLRLSW